MAKEQLGLEECLRRVRINRAGKLEWLEIARHVAELVAVSAQTGGMADTMATAVLLMKRTSFSTAKLSVHQLEGLALVLIAQIQKECTAVLASLIVRQSPYRGVLYSMGTLAVSANLSDPDDRMALEWLAQHRLVRFNEEAGTYLRL
ncbi:MAG TPA: hypothetical protein VLF67_03720, partial [Candidatus Saccharimonas sp.]|nr:hypothetical protein [Candidatus Saccharimonas sp.]